MSTVPPPSRTTSERLRAVEDDTRVVDVDRFVPATRDDVDDHALLPRQMRLLSGEVRDLVEMVRGTVVPALRRIEERQQDTDRYLVQIARGIHNRIDALKAVLEGALEAAAK